MQARLKQLIIRPADVKRLNWGPIKHIEFKFSEDYPGAAVMPNETNGDETKYDEDFNFKIGSYSKGLKQAREGIVDRDVWNAFRKATQAVGVNQGTAFGDSGIILGSDNKLNGPQGAFAGQLVGPPSRSYDDYFPVVPPAIETEDYAVELLELYWASLLRDTPFSSFTSPSADPAVKAAADELSKYSNHYFGPKTKDGKITPKLLFRGGMKRGDKSYFAGETTGPYLSQFCMLDCSLGALPFEQKYQRFAANQDYMIDIDAWYAVQKGAMPGDPKMAGIDYLSDGRSLAAYTRVDELYQAYFIAYLVLSAKDYGFPKNPGSPYRPAYAGGYKNEKPFGSFGGPDIASTIAAVARAAIDAVWYQKWVVHLRHRPEAGGGLLHLQTLEGKNFGVNFPKWLTESDAVHKCADLAFKRQGARSYLLSQAFPEGSPTHPAYPTGHGAVAGACITVLKFFFDGSYKIPNPLDSVADEANKGRFKLAPYEYDSNDDGEITVNGELHKLAHNISFGHGIHAGIHWRSDTDASMLLGEAVAIKFLEVQARNYTEYFKVKFKRMDGSECTIEHLPPATGAS